MIPDDVRRFVLTSIPSVPLLEAALLFVRNPAAHRTCAEVADALYIADTKAAELLAALVQVGVLAFPDADWPRYQYAPRDDALAAVLNRLARIYETEMIAITHLIHDAPGKSAQRFADAFKLRKDR